MRPRDLPPSSRWATRPHGTRLRYISGCKCVPCRAANSRYETSRLRLRKLGRGNGLVSSADATAHVRAFGRRGIGYKRVAAAAGVGKTTVLKMLTGRKPRIRAASARRLLAVTVAPAPGAYVPAARTWRLIDRLIAAGYPKRRIALWLGYRHGALQLRRDQITRRNELRIAKLYRWLMAEQRRGAA